MRSQDVGVRLAEARCDFRLRARRGSQHLGEGSRLTVQDPGLGILRNGLGRVSKF